MTSFAGVSVIVVTHWHEAPVRAFRGFLERKQIGFEGNVGVGSAVEL